MRCKAKRQGLEGLYMQGPRNSLPTYPFPAAKSKGLLSARADTGPALGLSCLQLPWGMKTCSFLLLIN